MYNEIICWVCINVLAYFVAILTNGLYFEFAILDDDFFESKPVCIVN